MKKRWTHAPLFTGIFFSLLLDRTIYSRILLLAFSFLADSRSSCRLIACCVGSTNTFRLPMMMEEGSQHPWGSQPGGKLFLMARTARSICIAVSR